MLKVLLVDDEPFILQGLKVLIDWEAEGFEIAKTVSNGQEALDYLRDNEVDLIIADINMPVVSGIELLETLRHDNISDAYFVILSGYAEFSYAQQAISYDCKEYIIKPVKKEVLLEILKKVVARNATKVQITQTNRQMEQAYLAKNLIHTIRGRYEASQIEYVRKNLQVSDEMRYIEIELDNLDIDEEITDEEKCAYQKKLFQACQEYLKEDGDHCVFDVSGQDKIYDIGFVYCSYMAEKGTVSEDKYLENFLKYLGATVPMPVVMLAGKKVSDISNLAHSYGSACMLRSLQGFNSHKDIHYYEDEAQVTGSGIVLCKKSLDDLLEAVEQNRQNDIEATVGRFFDEMQHTGVNGETVNLNINYLLFQFIHQATQQDNYVNQEEILRLMSEMSFEEGIMRGSRAHLTRLSCEYAEYLAQLRQNVSHGVLGNIEREIRNHYAENLTLKELSAKYYINSAYLGQLFRKKYGQSFKDYLNSYRMEKAVNLLLRTDKKIYQVAEAVGYKDLDYFVNRFIAAKGCTPAKYRRLSQTENKK